MKLQVLLSAMHLSDYEFIDSLHITGDCVVINQCDSEKEYHTSRGKQEITYIETKERGLSKSRNMALKYADADVCILCDNDVEYVENYETLITKAFADYPDADIIVFYIKRKEKPRPNYPEVRGMDYLSVLKIFSPEIAFRREAVLKNGICFDELFGAGAHYYMGEENIFLYDCLKKKMKIMYVPIQIATLLETESTWFSGYDERFFLSRGANYAAMSEWFSIILILQFAVRKRALYQDNLTFRQAIKQMRLGRREYLDREKKQS